MSSRQDTLGTWKGRRPKGQRDANSWQAFLSKTHTKILREHLSRHHKGMKV